MDSINRLQEEILHPSAEFLRGKGHNITSQYGEDGFIAHAMQQLFDRGVKFSKWCFEVGAGDGRFYSNTLNLRRFGWKAVLIEADEKQFERLKQDFSDTAHVVRLKIEPQGVDSLDALLQWFSPDRDPDLGVIDIDGLDYECWKHLTKFQPKLILIEYAPDEMHTWPRELWIPDQRNAADTIALGLEKGYLPLVKTYCNLLFARKDVWPGAA